MEAIFKIQPTEFNQKLFQNIKKMFEGKSVTITISTELDETDYLNANPANRRHLLDSMAQEPTVRFTPEEFDQHVENLLKDSFNYSLKSPLITLFGKVHFGKNNL